jgi:hypothetical protein
MQSLSRCPQIRLPSEESLERLSCFVAFKVRRLIPLQNEAFFGWNLETLVSFLLNHSSLALSPLSVIQQLAVITHFRISAWTGCNLDQPMRSFTRTHTALLAEA